MPACRRFRKRAVRRGPQALALTSENGTRLVLQALIGLKSITFTGRFTAAVFRPDAQREEAANSQIRREPSKPIGPPVNGEMAVALAVILCAAVPRTPTPLGNNGWMSRSTAVPAAPAAVQGVPNDGAVLEFYDVKTQQRVILVGYGFPGLHCAHVTLISAPAGG